jgi:hypothetical protein
MRICDVCEEEWEDSFFCPECSKGGHYEMVESPVLNWSGNPSDPETEIDEEFVANGYICLNCCDCHLRNGHGTKHKQINKSYLNEIIN